MNIILLCAQQDLVPLVRSPIRVNSHLIYSRRSPGMSKRVDCGPFYDHELPSDGLSHLLHKLQGDEESRRRKGEVDSLALTSFVKNKQLLRARGLAYRLTREAKQ